MSIRNKADKTAVFEAQQGDHTAVVEALLQWTIDHAPEDGGEEVDEVVEEEESPTTTG
jgi:hypothetical protein